MSSEHDRVLGNLNWLASIDNKEFVMNFCRFANVQQSYADRLLNNDEEEVVDLSINLIQEKRYKEWLDEVYEQLCMKMTKKRRANSMCGMKYDGRYSSYQSFLQTIVEAFSTNDPLAWIGIKKVLVKMHSEKQDISDYFNGFLYKLYSFLNDNRQRLLFASMLCDAAIACEFLEVCITEALMQVLQKLKFPKNNSHQRMSPKSAEKWLPEFYNEQNVLINSKFSNKNIEYAIQNIRNKRRYVEKGTLYINLYQRLSQEDLDLKKFINCYLRHLVNYWNKPELKDQLQILSKPI